jgi:hypothetical protein
MYQLKNAGGLEYIRSGFKTADQVSRLIAGLHALILTN